MISRKIADLLSSRTDSTFCLAKDIFDMVLLHSSSRSGGPDVKIVHICCHAMLCTQFDRVSVCDNVHVPR